MRQVSGRRRKNRQAERLTGNVNHALRSTQRRRAAPSLHAEVMVQAEAMRWREAELRRHSDVPRTDDTSRRPARAPNHRRFLAAPERRIGAGSHPIV